MLIEFLFTKIEEENTCHIAETTLADVIWPPQSCDLTSLDYYLFGAVKDKCYADNPETNDALKDNIREAVGEIQLHTIDNMLRNPTDRVGYCMPSGGSHLNEINRKDCTFK